MRFVGSERSSRELQIALSFRCERVRTTKHTPRGPLRLLERRYGLADIGERGAFVIAERRRVILSHLDRHIITFSENASRHGHRFEQQRFGFFEAQ